MSKKKGIFPRTEVTERHLRRVVALDDATLEKATGGLALGAYQQLAIPYGVDWNVELRKVVALP